MSPSIIEYRIFAKEITQKCDKKFNPHEKKWLTVICNCQRESLNIAKMNAPAELLSAANAHAKYFTPYQSRYFRIESGILKAVLI